MYKRAMKLTVNSLLTLGDSEVSETLTGDENGRLRDENDRFVKSWALLLNLSLIHISEPTRPKR